MKKLIINLLALSVVATALNACNNEDNNNNGTTRLEVRLTDAPGPYDQVNIDIQSVHINATNDEESGWQTLNLLEPGVYDLLEFTNGIDTLLAAQEIPAGLISQIRLVLGPNNSVVVDGVSHPLSTPSAQQSGLKLNLNADLTAGVAYRLWLDFDAQRSIVERGNGTYSLKPVIRAYTESTGGSLRGNVTPEEADAIVWAVIGTDSIAAIPDAAGNFIIAGLLPGTEWRVGYDASVESGYVDRVVTGITVTAGNVTQLAPVVLQPQVQ